MKLCQDTQAKRLEIGDVAPDFELDDATGAKRKLSSYRGYRILLSFQQFAAWPVCRYSVDRMKLQTRNLMQVGIVSICIYQSNKDFLQYAVKIGNDALLLADRKGKTFEDYVEAKGIAAVRMAQELYYKNPRRYLDWYAPGTNTVTVGKDKFGKMSATGYSPANFLINEEGVIEDLFRSDNVLDSIPFERIEAFVPEDKKCQCNQRDCLFTHCKDNYECIQKEAENTFGAE